MTHSPTAAQFARDEELRCEQCPWIVVAIGTCVALFGVVVMLGRQFSGSWPALLAAPFSSVQWNAAMGFSVAGVMLISAVRGMQRITVAGMYVLMLIGGGTLVQYLTGLNLFIDNAMAPHDAMHIAPLVERMSPNSAVAMVLTGASLMIGSRGVKHQARNAIAATIGCCVLGVGVVAMFGHAAGVDTAYGWGEVTSMPAYSACIVVLLGVGLVTLAWQQSGTNIMHPPAWSPIMVGIGLLVMTLMLWQAGDARENRIARDTTRAEARGTADRIREGLRNDIRAIEGMAARIGDDAYVNPQAWQLDARNHLTSIHELDSLIWTDFITRARRSVSHDGVEYRVVVEATPAEQMPGEQMHEIPAGRLIPAIGDNGGSVLCVRLPIVRGDQWVGNLSAEIDARQLVTRVISPRVVQRDYVVELSCDDQVLLAPRVHQEEKHHAMAATAAFEIAGSTWRVTLEPTDETIAGLRSRLPLLSIWVGIAFSVLGGMTAKLWKTACDRAEMARQAELRAREAKERFQLAVRGSTDGLWDWNLKTNEVWYSPRWKQMLGYADDELTNNLETFKSLLHLDDLKRVFNRVQQHFVHHEPYDVEFRFRRKNGSYMWIHARGQAVWDEQGKPYRMAGSHHDLTARKALEQRLRHDATHDALTDLPNRALLYDRIEQAMKRARRNRSHCFAIMFLDFDGFKQINDELGHDIGDEFLRGIAHRLKACLRDLDTVALMPGNHLPARLGGDEFVVMLDGVRDIDAVVMVAERIRQALREGYIIPGQPIKPSASIGIVTYDPRYDNSEQMIRDADAAMYVAKSTGKDRYEIFDASDERFHVDPSSR